MTNTDVRHDTHGEAPAGKVAPAPEQSAAAPSPFTPIAD